MPDNNGAGATVIVVDDSADIRDLLRYTLERRGCRVLEAENGREAVELAQRERPNLILMDLNMPVLDGLAATRILRGLAGMCDVPIIAISANGIESHRAAFAAGCNEYLTKPVDLVRLDQLLNGLLPV